MARYRAPQDRLSKPFGSRSCMTGAHEDCGHLGSIGYGFQDGGRLMLQLCHCGCHSTCPLAGRLLPVSRAIWVGLCECPGTELAEDRLDQAERGPNFRNFKRRLRELQEKRARERQEDR
jgi:hypothetical protein